MSFLLLGVGDSGTNLPSFHNITICIQDISATRPPASSTTIKICIQDISLTRPPISSTTIKICVQDISLTR